MDRQLAAYWQRSVRRHRGKWRERLEGRGKMGQCNPQGDDRCNRLQTGGDKGGGLWPSGRKLTPGLAWRVSGGVVVCFQDGGHDDRVLLYSTCTAYRIGNSGSFIAMLQYL